MSWHSFDNKKSKTQIKKQKNKEPFYATASRVWVMVALGGAGWCSGSLNVVDGIK